MKARDLKPRDIIAGETVTDVTIAEVVILTMEDGRRVKHMGDDVVDATRLVPDTVMPKDAVRLTVIANGVTMRVSEVFPSDGCSFILVGQGYSGGNHWERVYDNEELKVVG